MSANDKQVAGDHYKVDYQHWDMLVMMGYGSEYYAGQVTKYVTRWRKKNGLRDLLKAQHFAEKLREIVAEKGDKFLKFNGIAEGDLRVVIKAHLDEHLNHYFTVNEVGTDERNIIISIMFSPDLQSVDSTLVAMQELVDKARVAARDKMDAENPVSKNFDFIGYSEDSISWSCKKCGCRLTLPMDRPPIYEHRACAPV